MPDINKEILDAVHETVTDLKEAGLVDDITMRNFDVLCLPSVKNYDAKDIVRIRKSSRTSQAVFAKYLNVTKSTVSQWEQGLKKPRGASAKLLDIVERNGLAYLA